ncbi:MAG: hypothetical protein KGI27_12200 [Thaumarchaeota archaeon]|nr:hypothetical protein [Nitrososphaerota archaeon]
MRPIVYGAIGGGAAVVVAVIAIFVLGSPAQQYSLSVEPQTGTGMGNMAYTDLKIKNTGTSDLTNIKVDYGQTSEKIPALEPGQWVDLSPPSSATMVTVTCDQGVTVTKQIESAGS